MDGAGKGAGLDMSKQPQLAVKPKATAKKKPRGKPFTGRGDPRNNLDGAPKRGQSLKEIAKTIGDMTPKEAAEWCKQIAGKIGVIGDSVTLKEAVVLRIYTALLFEPDAKLFDAIMNRDEGKVSQPVEVYDWRKEAALIGYDANELFAELVNAARTRIAADHRSGDAGSVAGGESSAVIDNTASTTQDATR